jgi:WS/DGAT/MGAT family acyltransferase
MTLDRLSALDESFLRLESDAAHMHVGWTLVVDGNPPTLEALRAHVVCRLELLPRFRRRVLASSLRLHDAVWVDDQTFDVSHHVDRVTAPCPGGPAELRTLTGELLSTPLDRDRPLWRLALVDGLEGGRFAIVGKAHHALVDGIAAVEVTQLLLDGDPGPRSALARPWSPAPVPALVERVRGSVAERMRLGRAIGSIGLRAVRAPSLVTEGIAGVRRIGSALGAVGSPAPSTPLNRRIGPRRSVAYAELPLDAAKELGRQRGATVNDVVLATSALALGRYLRRRGESQPWLRAFVPVSTRAGGSGQAGGSQEVGGGGEVGGNGRARASGAELGNRISVVFVELPIAQRDPSAALDEVCRQTRVLKRSDHAASVDALLRAAGLMPAPMRDAFAWLIARPQTFNAVVSNVPGPSAPLYLLGRRVLAAYPAVPLAQGHGLSVGVLSYCGTLHVGLYADPGVVPSVLEVASDFSRSFDALRFAVGPRKPEPDPTPPSIGEGVRNETPIRERALV